MAILAIYTIILSPAVGRWVGCGHLIHSFGVQTVGVAALGVIVFESAKKVLGDRMSTVPRPGLSLTARTRR